MATHRGLKPPGYKTTPDKSGSTPRATKFAIALSATDTKLTLALIRAIIITIELIGLIELIRCLARHKGVA